MLLQAVALARKNQVDFLLAVGGGSVLNGTKFIAAAVPFPGDPWDILAKKAPLQSALPLGTVATYGQVARLANLTGQARLVGYAPQSSSGHSLASGDRVINAKGEISYDAFRHGNDDLQRVLLEAEGVVFAGKSVCRITSGNRPGQPLGCKGDTAGLDS
jgi:alkylated DNA nucleotide flippase Atl1